MAVPLRNTLPQVFEFFNVLTPILRDDIYEVLEKYMHHIQTPGRGRRPALPKGLTCNNKFLLQLYVLRQIMPGLQWKDICEVFNRLFPTVDKSKVRYQVEKSFRHCEKKFMHNEEYLAFLTEEVKFQQVQAKFFPDNLKEECILDSIENLSSLVKNMPLTNGIVAGVHKLCKKNNVSNKRRRQILECFKSDRYNYSDTKFNRRVENILKEFLALSKNNNNSCGKGQADVFLTRAVFSDASHQPDDTIFPTKPTDMLPVHTSVPSISPKLHKCSAAALGHEVRVLKGQVESMATENKHLLVQLEAMKEVNVSTNESFQEERAKCDALRNELILAKEKIKALCNESEKLESEFSSLKSKNSSLQQSAYYKRLKGRELKLKECDEALVQHMDNRCDLIISQLKLKVKSLQTKLSNKRLSLVKCKDQKAQLKEKLINMEKDFVCDVTEKESGSLKTKNGNGYSDDMVKTIIELVGEAEVPAGRCGQVIRTIGENLFHAQIDDLPSERSSLRFADQGHVLAKYHIASAIDNSDHFDLHSDGTTKDHTKFIGQQLTLDSGETLSAGYTSVAKEDADTILDVTIQLFQEISDIYSDETEKYYKIILGKMVGLMSDRASVMKSFDKKFDTYRKDLLQTEEGLEFIHCNAHFLLGLSSEAERVLKEITKGEKLGRDKDPSLGRYSGIGESCVGRHIRLACDSLGPRGDEKSGCRRAWEAYCHMQGTPSQITSFRSNRFNNYFQAAVALHYHRNGMIKYFEHYYSNGNNKLRSVLLDAKDEDIDSFLTALGILYHKITGPYWLLIRSKVQYLDFYIFVEKLYNALKTWSEDATPLLQPDTYLFDTYPVRTSDGLKSLYENLPTPSKESWNVVIVLQRLATAFLDVVKRQLQDFLPGGRYHSIKDELTRKKMQHCQLTNLVGEACFGDLDFSLFKRRNSSLHHHSTINMLKRNRTMSLWFAVQPGEIQKTLLQKSASLGRSVREQHRSATRRVFAEVKNTLKEKAQKKILDVQQRKEKIANNVRDHGGPCLSLRDVNCFLARSGLSSRTKAIKAEILYQKIVLGHKSKQLRVTGKADVLISNLKEFFKEKENSDTSTSTSDDAHLSMVDPLLNFDGSSNDGGDHVNELTDTSDSDKESTGDHDEANAPLFKFSGQGTWVAVFYDTSCGQEFFIGEVSALKNENVAEVNFLEQCRVKETMFRYPSLPSKSLVEAKFVVAWDFNVTTTNGRIWNVLDIKDIKKKFRIYLKMYCGI